MFRGGTSADFSALVKAVFNIIWTFHRM